MHVSQVMIDQLQINNIVCSARFALPGPEQKSIVSTTGNSVINQNPSEIISQLHLPPPENTAQEK